MCLTPSAPYSSWKSPRSQCRCKPSPVSISPTIGVSSAPTLRFPKFLRLDEMTKSNKGKMFGTRYANLMETLNKNSRSHENDRELLRVNHIRNASLDPHVVELHYLPVQLALQVLAARMDKIRGYGVEKILHVCVGKGRGSKDGFPAVRNAVLKNAPRLGYRCQTSDVNPGLIIITVLPNLC